MKKRSLLIPFLLLTFILFVPMNVKATCSHNWVSEDYYEQSGNNQTHKHYYQCEKCYEEKYVTENCTWELTGTYYENLNTCSHIQEQDYQCQKCYANKEVKTTMNHVLGWQKYDSDFSYECKDCSFEPLYNGSILYDYSKLDHYSLKHGKKLTYTCYYYQKSLNPIVSVKSSKKKVCTVSKKGKKVLIKGKKKGSSTVTVKMKSGAVYTLKIKVK